MNKMKVQAAIALACCFTARPVFSQVTVYTDEQTYLDALAVLGYATNSQGFENNDDWGLLELFTVTDATSQGVTWSALSNAISLNNGIRRGGEWGLVPSPPSIPFNGLTGTNASGGTMFGVGGWVRSGTAPRDVFLYLNGDNSNSLLDNGVTSTPSFFGVIDTNGITSFEFSTEEVPPGDNAKLIYLDDFTFGFSVLPSLREPGVLWSNAAGGDYALAGNWAGGLVPLPAENAAFLGGNALPMTVSFSQDETASQATVRHDQVIFDLGGNTYNLTQPNITRESLIVGELNGDVGNLSIQNGTVSGVNTVVAHSEGANGQLTVHNGGHLAMTGHLRVGSGGVGQMDIAAGSTVSSDFSVVGMFGGTGTVNVDGAGAQWNATTLNVGMGGNGQLSITDGAHVTTNTLTASLKLGNGLASDFAGTGNILVSGAGSLLNANTVIIGETGVASIQINDAGAAASRNVQIGISADASATVSGLNARWDILVTSGFSRGTLRVGTGDQIGNFYTSSTVFKNGTLLIENGGTVVTDDLFVGQTRAGKGTVTIDGLGSTLDTGMRFPGNSFIGYEGNGVLNVINGGTFLSRHVYVGRFGIRNKLKGEVNVTGPTSTWTSSGALYVGANNNNTNQPYNAGSTFFSEGTVNVTQGGTVTALSLTLGDRRLSRGNVNIDGVGSTITVGSVRIGHLETFSAGTFGTSFEGEGLLSVSNGGHLEVTGDIRLVAGVLDLNNGSVSAATLFVKGESFTNPTQVLLSGSGVIDANVINSGGVIAPGHSAGKLTIDGDLTQLVDGALAIELGGLTQGSEFDFVQVSGAVQLGGTLEVSLIDSFATTAGNRFDILDGASIAGTFDSITLAALDADLGWNLSDLYTAGELRVELAGDLDGDGQVGAGDLDILLANWGSSGDLFDYALGDASGDGFVGQADLQLVLDHFGNTTAAGPSVPEPSSLSLLAITALCCLRRRNSRSTS